MKTLAGTGGLVRLILRRDRILLPLWIVPLAVIPISYVQSFGDLFPDGGIAAEVREQRRFHHPVRRTVRDQPG